jgi:DNA repair protein RecO (recombination protein O)
MVETVTAVGMVISSMAISEYDKRLVILTKEFGKITAFARGARKPTSPFLGGSQPMAFGEFTLYRGRNAYTITEMKISDYFSNTMNNIDSMYMGMYFLELADYYGREGIEASETLKLLYLSMKSLSRNKIPQDLIRCVYELKTLVINGEYPNVFSCGNCGGKDGLDYFDISHDTMLCKNCHGNISGDKILNVPPTGSVRRGTFLSDSSVYALQFIVVTPVNKLFSFTVTEEVLEQMKRVVKSYMDKVIDKKFNSLEFL